MDAKATIQVSMGMSIPNKVNTADRYAPADFYVTLKG